MKTHLLSTLLTRQRAEIRLFGQNSILTGQELLSSIIDIPYEAINHDFNIYTLKEAIFASRLLILSYMAGAFYYRL